MVEEEEEKHWLCLRHLNAYVAKMEMFEEWEAWRRRSSRHSWKYLTHSYATIANWCFVLDKLEKEKGKGD